MADGTITERLVFDYSQALSAVQRMVEETDRAARAQRELEQRAKMSESALRRLEDLSVGSGAERAALSYQRQAAEIQRLAEVTGNHDLAARAMANLNAEAAQRLQVTTAATKDLGRAHVDTADAAVRATVSHGQLAAGMSNLGAQAADVAVSLASGASPAMVLVQQGPQIAGAVTQMGGLGAAFRALAPLAAAAAPVVAGLAVAVAAVGTAYVTWSNLTTTATSEATAQSQALIEQAGAADQSAEKVRELADAWTAYLSISRDVSERTAAINGTLTEGQRQAGASARQIDTAAASVLQSQAREVAELTVALQAAEQLSANQGASVSERAAASGQLASLQARLDKAREALSATRAQVAADKAGAEALGEYADAEKQAAEFIRQREEASRAAAEATRAEREELERMIATSKARADMGPAMAAAEAAVMATRGATAQDRQWATFGSSLTAAGAQAAENEVARQAEERERWKRFTAGLELNTFATEESTRQTVQLTEATILGAANAVGNFASGPQAFMSSMGPWGAAISGIISAITNLDGTFAQFRTWHLEASKAFQELPQTLVENLIPALIEGTAAFLTILPELILNLFSPERWEDVGIDMAKGFVKAMAESWGDLLLGPERQGVFSDIWQGNEGQGGLKGAGNWIAGLFSSRDSNVDAAALATRTTREGAASTSRTRRSGVTVNVGHAYGGQAGLREIADLIQTDAAISRYGAWGT